MCQNIETDNNTEADNASAKLPRTPTATGTDKNLVAYEQSVKAYQFQVTRYNTWMNYYALFVGALFVAFYMIICYSQSCSCTCCFCWMCCSCDDELPSTKFLLIFITILGIVASTCWMASLIGNCAWMNNYIKAVKKNEEAFFGADNANLVVYRRLIKNSSNGRTRSSRGKCWKAFMIYLTKKIIKKIIGNNRKEFISTQKMTQWFVGAVLAAWVYILIYLVLSCFDAPNVLCYLWILGSIILAWGIWALFKFTRCCLYSDDLSGMI